MASQTFALGSVATVNWWNDVNDAINDDVVNVKSTVYGAVGNDSNDDTEELQAAITAAVAGKKPLILPAGTYKITAGLTCNGPIKIIGAGANQTIIKYYATTGTAFTFTNAPGSYDDGFSMQGIKFEQENAKAGSAIGLKFQGIVWNVSSVQDVQVLNFGGTGIYVDDCLTASFERVRSAQNNGAGWTIVKSNGVTLIHCSAESNRSNGYSLSNDGTAGERYGIALIECHAEENCGHAVYAHESNSLLISGGWWQVAGLNPSDGTSQANAFSAFELDATTYCIVTGARITTGGNTSLLVGVNFNGALYSTVSNNTFSSFASGKDVVGTASSGRNGVFGCSGSGAQKQITYTDSSSTGNVYSNHLGSGSDYGMEWFAKYHSFQTVAGSEKLRVDTNGVNFVNHTTGTSAPSAGGAGALPATPAGYITVKIGGTNRQIPYY